MGLYSDPPPLHPFSQDKPTLLVCWWITTFCTVLILLRVSGRYIRTETLFREDKTAALALVPLLLRMGCVHVVLLWGTNNVDLDGVRLSEIELRRREVGSGLVLAARVLYAASLWILKHAILDFFRRLSNVTWRRSHELVLLWFRRFLAATFIAILISGLAECRPFPHYWQVVPDPGGQCRQGYAQLLTMAVCNIMTDLSLVLFPAPVIIRSSMSARKKVQLVLLFSLSLGPVMVTLYRVPRVIAEHGSQDVRSLYASVELLLATAAANALVLGSFVRDRGIKKRRYRYELIAAASSVDPSVVSETRRPSALRYWGSDEDLVRDLGLGLKPELREDYLSPSDGERRPSYIPAPTVANNPREAMARWQFPGADGENRLAVPTPGSDDLERGGRSVRSDSSVTPRRVSFFDYGGLLSDTNTTTDSQPIRIEPYASGAVNPSDSPRERSGSTSSQTVSPTTPASVRPAGVSGFRRSSVALLQDIGGLLTRSSSVGKGKFTRPKLGRSNTTGSGFGRSTRSGMETTQVSPMTTTTTGKEVSETSSPVEEKPPVRLDQQSQPQTQEPERPKLERSRSEPWHPPGPNK